MLRISRAKKKAGAYKACIANQKSLAVLGLSSIRSSFRSRRKLRTPGRLTRRYMHPRRTQSCRRSSRTARYRISSHTASRSRQAAQLTSAGARRELELDTWLSPLLSSSTMLRLTEERWAGSAGSARVLKSVGCRTEIEICRLAGSRLEAKFLARLISGGPRFNCLGEPQAGVYKVPDIEREIDERLSYFYHTTLCRAHYEARE